MFLHSTSFVHSTWSPLTPTRQTRVAVTQTVCTARRPQPPPTDPTPKPSSPQTPNPPPSARAPKPPPPSPPPPSTSPTPISAPPQEIPNIPNTTIAADSTTATGSRPPLRQRARRRRPDSKTGTPTEDDDLDWDRLPSVPLVRPDASPESGEDYWIDLDTVPGIGAKASRRSSPAVSSDSSPSGAEGGVARNVRQQRGIDDKLKERLKQEVVSPYEQNWILRVAVVVFVLAVLVAIFGGLDTVPIIQVPDL